MHTDPGKADLRAAGLHQAAGSSEHQGGMMAGHQANRDGGILGWWRRWITSSAGFGLSLSDMTRVRDVCHGETDERAKSYVKLST